jgi:hypothetical protein
LSDVHSLEALALDSQALKLSYPPTSQIMTHPCQKKTRPSDLSGPTSLIRHVSAQNCVVILIRDIFISFLVSYRPRTHKIANGDTNHSISVLAHFAHSIGCFPKSKRKLKFAVTDAAAVRLAAFTHWRWRTFV